MRWDKDAHTGQIDPNPLYGFPRRWYDSAMLVCFTGGGTLGHIYPALAVHQELAEAESYSGFWIGRNDPTEKRIVEEAGLSFHPIPSGKLRRYPSLRNVTDGFKVLWAIGSAYRILKRRKPDLLFSKGGFVSVPPVVAAHLLKIPVISHESDISPGLATRINARFSDLVCVPFAEGFDHLGRKKLRVTGNPVRKDLLEAVRTPFVRSDDARPLLLVLGGSGGSAAVNALIEETLDELLLVCSVHHQVGPDTPLPPSRPDYTAVEFIGEELASLLHKADLIVSRSGAGVLEELKLFGKASILLPLGRKTSRGEQEANARHLEAKGAAVVLYEPVDPDVFVRTVRSLIDDSAGRENLARTMGSLGDGSAARTIGAIILGWRNV